MAEFAVNFVVGKLSPLLVEEMELSNAIRKEVLGIKSELEIIRAFLMDAEGRAAAEKEGACEEGVKTWVKQVREEAYQIEDVIDEFSSATAHLPHGSGLASILHKLRRHIKRLKLNHEIATEIQVIKSSLADIQRRAQVYHFRYIDQQPICGTPYVILHDSQDTSFFIDDAEVVGIESTRDDLIDLLVNGKSHRSVLVVAAKGGCGKTTLAGKIHNNDAVKRHFDCQAWITVGKEYIRKDKLKRIAIEFGRLKPEFIPRQMDIMEEKELITMLREYLEEKCCMVVFDDVWKIDFWSDVEHALLDSNQGSRIIITTRNRSVAELVPSSIVHLHQLEPLPPDKSWLLFCRKAFGSDECPQELKELSQNIVEKCEGLPLGIVAVGGLMSAKYKIVSEWQKLLYGLGSKLKAIPI